MPGKLGIRPVHKSFSVPVEIPLQKVATRTSSAPSGARASGRNASRPGASSMTASASIPSPAAEPAPHWAAPANVTL